MCRGCQEWGIGVKKDGCAALFLIKKINHKRQVKREAHPQYIRNLQICGERFDFMETYYHNKNKNPQKREPYNREKIRLHIKEDNTPEKVDDKLEGIHLQRARHICFILFNVYHRARNSHEHKQYRPRDRERPHRRRQRGTVKRVVHIHIAPCQKSRQASYREGYCDWYDVRFYFIPHFNHLLHCILCVFGIDNSRRIVKIT